MTNSTQPVPALYTAAAACHQHGIMTTPVRSDGTKAPALKSWQDRPPTEQDLWDWFGTGRFTAMGILTGAASGGLEMTEIEGEYTHHLVALQDLAHSRPETAEIWERVNTGWVEESPSGGIHWIYRVTGMDVPGNQKLAQDEPRTNPETGRRTVPTIAETRGQGGQFVAAPTPGEAHETGNPWRVLAGGPETVPTLTVDERDAFHSLLATLDRRVTTAPKPVADTRPDLTMTGTIGALEQAHQQRLDAAGTSPGDDFETKTSWEDLLEPAGWHINHTDGTTTYWTRPGKRYGISATTGHATDRDRLFVFSSSTEFPTFEPITKFSAYAVLEHNGDHSAAAAKLRAEGYGAPARIAVPTGAPVYAAQPGAVHAPGPAGNTPPTGHQVNGPHTIATGVQTESGAVIHFPSNGHSPADPVAGLQDQLNATAGGAPAFNNTTLDLTDDSNAIALIRDYGEVIRFDADRGRWLSWNTHTWQPQPKNGGAVRELAKQVGRALPEDGPEGASKTIKHKRYTLSSRGTTALLDTAATDRNILVSSDDLDQHPYELNTPAGIVDLRTGQMTPSDPAKLHTRATKVAPDPAADRSMWENFLAQTFPDSEIRGYVQRLIGNSILGNVHEHVLPFAHGSGGNGKGVFLEAIKDVLGSYAGSAPAGFLMANTYQQHATELADLQGRRFVIASEINSGDKFDEAKVKALTGGDTVKARFMRQDFFEFKPTHTIWLMGNDQPDVDSGGRAFWRRLRLIPFTNEVAEQDKIEDLQTILATKHGPAILQWAVEGAVDYLANGLQEPAVVKAATDAYAESVDTVGRFIEEECHLLEGYNTPVNTVRAAYEEWCRAAGERPITGRSFATQLGRHGVLVGRKAPRVASGQPRVYGGIVLAAPETGDQHDGDRGGF